MFWRGTMTNPQTRKRSDTDTCMADTAHDERVRSLLSRIPFPHTFHFYSLCAGPCTPLSPCTKQHLFQHHFQPSPRVPPPPHSPPDPSQHKSLTLRNKLLSELHINCPHQQGVVHEMVHVDRQLVSAVLSTKDMFDAQQGINIQLNSRHLHWNISDNLPQTAGSGRIMGKSEGGSWTMLILRNRVIAGKKRMTAQRGICSEREENGIAFTEQRALNVAFHRRARLQHAGQQ